MKYSEKKSKWVYDWPQIIRDLEANSYTEHAFDEVFTAACSWVTCACGNQCAALERGSFGKPADTKLAELGADFPSHISLIFYSTTVKGRRRYAGRARKHLAKIEARAKELLS